MNNVMTPIIDQNQSARKFDFSSLITKADDLAACNTVRSIIADGNYFTNSPKFQTKENIFARQESIWLKYRVSFMMSVFLYLGREAKISNMMAWSFMTNLESAEDRENLWHHHWHPTTPTSKILSGIWYLHIPEDVKDRDYCGTEMAPQGPQADDRYYVRPTDGNWLIYPGDMWHRPGIVQSDQYRFVLAADIQID
jgi:hypothetical protein